MERDILGEVTKRYQPNVAMQNLGRIKPDQLGKVISVVLPIFERACRYIRAHSQPMETLGIPPRSRSWKRTGGSSRKRTSATPADGHNSYRFHH